MKAVDVKLAPSLLASMAEELSDLRYRTDWLDRMDWQWYESLHWCQNICAFSMLMLCSCLISIWLLFLRSFHLFLSLSYVEKSLSEDFFRPMLFHRHYFIVGRQKW